ncbi:MAG: hypothetical protein ACE5KE_14550 [Methanosarcinales archaeon]
MATKEEILQKHNLTPRVWSFFASAYFTLSRELQEKFNKATIDISENATDLTKDEALFISSFDLDMARKGLKPILTEKAKKKLKEVV